MSGHQCYHCKQWVEEGEAHDCWTTTEAALTADLSVDLQEAWERLREAAAEFGDQRIYASHKSIMFARESCYLLRPTDERTFLELCVFPRPRRRGPTGAPCGPGVEVQAAAHDSFPPPGRGGAAHHRLAGRGLRALRRAVRLGVAAGHRIRDVARRSPEYRRPRLGPRVGGAATPINPQGVRRSSGCQERSKSSARGCGSFASAVQRGPGGAASGMARAT